jgi:methyl-accepting chemotaxis protein
VTASNEASVNVETVAVAADELAGSIGEIGRQLSLTTDVVRGAVTEAQGTNQQITALAQAARKIGDVVKLIPTIAAQTNLLALNATIEAARAGGGDRPDLEPHAGNRQLHQRRLGRGRAAKRRDG